MLTLASRSLLLLFLPALVLSIGCEKPEPVITYTVPTEVPPELLPGKERMLAAMVPKGDQVWFFKVTGPEDALSRIESTYRTFVESIEIEAGEPDLKELPGQWRRGADKPFRFASIDVETPNKQLDISISNLPRRDDWDDFVAQNVNRWRQQLGLPPSDDKWAGGSEFESATADAPSVWVDLIGEPGATGSMASSSRPFANHPPIPPGPMPAGPMPVNEGPSGQADGTAAAKPDPRFSFDRPEGWRDGRKGSMRWGAFNVGPEDSPAEITLIPAGGDLRGNVARWLGQIRGQQVPGEVVDQALADAKKVEIDGRPSQRFLLTDSDPESGDAIDATIVPMDNGMSLFIKMHGPVETVTSQSDKIASFLESLKLNL